MAKKFQLRGGRDNQDDVKNGHTRSNTDFSDGANVGATRHTSQTDILRNVLDKGFGTDDSNKFSLPGGDKNGDNKNICCLCLDEMTGADQLVSPPLYDKNYDKNGKNYSGGPNLSELILYAGISTHFNSYA